MKSNIIIYNIANKMISSYILLIIINILTYNHLINSYLIFPLEYLPDKNYKFIKDNNIKQSFPEEIIQQIYYKNLITKLDIGSPIKTIPLLIETNNEKFSLLSFNYSVQMNEKAKDLNFYKFSENDFYNESLSSTNINNTCEQSKFYPYNEICKSKDIINFNINNTYFKKEFPFKLIKKSDENIPGYIGLLYNDSNYEYTKGFITELKANKLINNYYWFFNFNEFSPLDKKLKAQFIVGGLPHEIFPNKYLLYDFETTNSAEITLNVGRAWRLNLNKIYIDNQQDKIITINNKVMTFNYEIYNIISSMEFHFEIRDLLMDNLVKEGKCFSNSFSQNLYSSFNLTFYYCNKSAKDILYEKLPNLKFSSIELDYIFELTYEELFYEKDDYIYFMILFTKYESNTHWIMGQIFTSKYNFVFNSDLKQIGFYKKVSHDNNDEDKDINPGNDEGKDNKKDDNNKYENNQKISTVLIIIIVAIGIALVFTIVGLVLGKKIFGWRRKIIANELTDELDYEYKSKDDINFKPEESDNNNNKNNKEVSFGINNNNIN